MKKFNPKSILVQAGSVMIEFIRTTYLKFNRHRSTGLDIAEKMCCDVTLDLHTHK